MKILIVPLAVMSLLWLACSNNHSHDHHTPHVEQSMETFTIYSDKTELFVEFAPMSVGSESRFAAHFTVLGEAFTPLSEGSVTLKLEIDNSTQEFTANEPEVPGIFRLRITPEKKGRGRLIFRIKTQDYTDEIIINDIAVFPNKQLAQAAFVSSGNENDISFLKEQAWLIPFANVEVKKIPYNEVIRVAGQIVSAPGDEAIISSPASGRIVFSESAKIPGENIRAGTRLFFVSGSGVTSDNVNVRLTEAKVVYENAEAEYNRAKTLVEDKIISKRDFETAKGNYETTRVLYQNIAKNFDTEKGLAVTSPMDGFIKNILVSDGQFVNSGDPLASVSKNIKLHLAANVSQSYFEKLKLITEANFKVSGSETVFRTSELNGKVITYGKSAGQNSPFVTVVFAFDNPSTLLPGSVVETFIKLTPIDSALIVPTSALMEEQGAFFVYVQIGGESFKKQEVVPGIGDGRFVPLLSGVEEGERVVTLGAHRIKLATASGAIPEHGHEH